MRNENIFNIFNKQNNKHASNAEVMTAWNESLRYSIFGLTMDGIIMIRDCQGNEHVTTDNLVLESVCIYTNILHHLFRISFYLESKLE